MPFAASSRRNTGRSAGYSGSKKGEFTALLTPLAGQRRLPSETRADADAVHARPGRAFSDRSVQPKQRSQKPPAPFTTSTLQQATSSHLHMSPDESMRQAQLLYEAGLDHLHAHRQPRSSPEGQALARETIRARTGKRISAAASTRPKVAPRKRTECIRPTDYPQYDGYGQGGAGGQKPARRRGLRSDLPPLPCQPDGLGGLRRGACHRRRG